MPTLQTQSRTIRAVNRLIGFPSASIGHCDRLSPLRPRTPSRQRLRQGHHLASIRVTDFLGFKFSYASPFILRKILKISYVLRSRSRRWSRVALAQISLHTTWQQRRHLSQPLLHHAIVPALSRHDRHHGPTCQNIICQNIHRRLQLAHALGDRALIQTLESELAAIESAIWLI
jgi:hypothetical protein